MKAAALRRLPCRKTRWGLHQSGPLLPHQKAVDQREHQDGEQQHHHALDERETALLTRTQSPSGSCPPEYLDGLGW
jgi:hypothetical protein